MSSSWDLESPPDWLRACALELLEQQVAAFPMSRGLSRPLRESVMITVWHPGCRSSNNPVPVARRLLTVIVPVSQTESYHGLRINVYRIAGSGESSRSGDLCLPESRPLGEYLRAACIRGQYAICELTSEISGTGARPSWWYLSQASIYELRPHQGGLTMAYLLGQQRPTGTVFYTTGC